MDFYDLFPLIIIDKLDLVRPMALRRVDLVSALGQGLVKLWE